MLIDHQRWSAQRYVSGKPLLAQAVIRYKLAQMIAKVEAMQAWLESVTYQMCNMVRGLMCSMCSYALTLLILCRPIKSNLAILPGRSYLAQS